MKGKNNSQLKTKTNNVKQVALLGILLALGIVLSLVESIIPIPVPAPGIRLGLSNIVIMFSLFFLRRRDALSLAVLKSLFVFATRGTVAGALSLCGGLSSICIMILLMHLFKTKISYLILSVSGAVFHNIGQITAASAVLGMPLWFYLPFLILSGIIAGSVTSVLLKVSIPVFAKLKLK